MKKMKKSNKGFTLTELAIVIAVIAILIAVLVPTFTSLINRAHESTDSQLAKNMNTLLSTAELDGTPERMDDVNEILVDGGYTLSKLSPTADGNIFVWNSDTNRISYIDEDGIVLYAGDSTLTADEAFTGGNSYWLTVETTDEIETWASYQVSYYIASKNFEDLTITFGYAAGIDTGSYTVSAVTYKSGANFSYEKASAKTAVGGSNVKKATADTDSTITAVVRGEVENLTVSNGNVYVENKASVTEKTTVSAAKKYTENGYSIALEASSGVEILIDEKGMVETLSGTSSTITNKGYIGTISGNGITGVTATVKSSYVYTISNYSELAAFRDKVNGGMTFTGLKVSLTANIDISNRVWVPIGYDSRDSAKNYHQGKTDTVYKYFAGTFEGNNHTISGLTNTGFSPTKTRTDVYGNKTDVNNYLFGFFGIINGATIQNLTMTNVNIVEEDAVTDSAGAIAGFASGGFTISNCTVYGSIEATDAAAGIIGRIYTYDCNSEDKSENADNTNYNADYPQNINGAGSITITKCINYADITITDTTNTTSKAAGIVGYFNDCSKIGISISYCENYGDISANIYTAGIITANTGKVALSYCVNTGDITSTNVDGSTSVDSSGNVKAAGSHAGSMVSYLTNYSSNGSQSTTWTLTSCSNSGKIKSNGNGYVFDFVTTEDTDGTETTTYTATEWEKGAVKKTTTDDSSGSSSS